jgi:predicted Fe-Mo cluster-binding NifX family protein
LKLKVAVATQGSDGLKDSVSDVFGRARTFTIVEIESGRIKGTKVMNNPATSLEYGVGPIVTEKLAEEKVNIVIAAEFGPGVSAFLKDKNIRTVKAKAGTNVRQAVEALLKSEHRGDCR